MERADITHDRHRDWSHCDFQGKLPSELFREHIVTCFIDENYDAIGEDMICWECDFLHADTTCPQAPEFLRRSLTGVSDSIIDKVTHQNAMRLYHFDLFAQRTRAQSTVVPCARSKARGNSPGEKCERRKARRHRPPRHVGRREPHDVGIGRTKVKMRPKGPIGKG